MIANIPAPDQASLSGLPPSQAKQLNQHDTTVGTEHLKLATIRYLLLWLMKIKCNNFEGAPVTENILYVINILLVNNKI